MKISIPIEQLLRWRLAQAEAAAPLPPRAAQLLEKLAQEKEHSNATDGTPFRFPVNSDSNGI